MPQEDFAGLETSTSCVVLRPGTISCDTSTGSGNIFFLTFTLYGKCNQVLRHKHGQITWFWTCYGAGSLLWALHRGGPWSVPGRSVWDLRWKRHWDRLFSKHFGSPLPASIHRCSVFIHSYIGDTLYSRQSFNNALKNLVNEFNISHPVH
jgi:hypothetical protein